jgi:hypothetical protein
MPTTHLPALLAMLLPLPALTQSAAPGARVPAQPDVLGNPQCRFRAVPELLLTDGRPGAVKQAMFSLAPREGGKDARLAVGAQPAKPCPECAKVSNWRGILAKPYFQLEGAGYTAAQATAATLVVDGAPVGISFLVRHSSDPYQAGKFLSRLAVNVPVPDEGKLVEAIARGRVAELRIYAATGTQLGIGTFDVGTLRLMPAELESARWSCG